MKNILIVVFVIFSYSFGFCQTVEVYVRVYLTDKSCTQHLLNTPEKFLSEMALQRRKNGGYSVNFSDIPLCKSYVTEIEHITGVKKHNFSNWFNYVTFKLPNQALVPQIKLLPFVKDVLVYNKNAEQFKTNKVSKFQNFMPQKSAQTPLLINNLYGRSYKQIEMLNLHTLHEEGFLGNDIKIAVFDAGFMGVDTLQTFKHLYQNNRVLGTYNLVENSFNVYKLHTHGTYVLSTIAANQNGLLMGTAPHASFYLFVTEYGPTETKQEEENWVRAAEMADSLGVDIINSSLGYTEFDNTAESYTYANMDGNTALITKGADLAASKGILVVNSAGNSGNNSWKFIGAPADGDSVLAVGAVDTLKQMAVFSSYGPSADNRIKPNVCAVGQFAAVTNFNNSVSYSNGTSFSSPIIAGAAAVLWQKFPNVNNMEIFKAIQNSAHLFPSPNEHYGYGIPNFKAASDSLTALTYKDLHMLHGVFPNPMVNNCKITYYSEKNQQLNLRVFNMSGHLIYHYNIQAISGFNFYNLITDSWLPGVYFLEVLGNEIILKEKLIKISR